MGDGFVQIISSSWGGREPKFINRAQVLTHKWFIIYLEKETNSKLGRSSESTGRAQGEMITDQSTWHMSGSQAHEPSTREVWGRLLEEQA